MKKKWLIRMSEEPDMINTTLDNRISLRQLIVGVSLFFAFQDIRKSKNMLNSDKQKIKIASCLFQYQGWSLWHLLN